MKIYLDNNLGVTNVEQEELTQDTIGYNILKVYIPNAVLTPYDTFTCYYGALLQNGRKVGWFAMEARTSSDTDYEANYTLYKATLEQCIVSVEGKVYIGCQVLLGNSGNATLIKKNTAVVQFNVRKSVAINNDILVLDTDQTTTDVLESYKNLLENALTTYATKATTYTKTEVDGKLDLKADKSDTYTKTEVDTINLNLAGQIAGARVELNNRINATNNILVETNAKVASLETDVADLKSVQNVVDIVPTYSALQSYDTSKLDVNDKVQVIADETHDGASTIYNWSGSAWQYVGAYGTNAAPKSTAITHTGNQLQDYSGNNIYPNVDNTELNIAKKNSVRYYNNSNIMVGIDWVDNYFKEYNTGNKVYNNTYCYSYLISCKPNTYYINNNTQCHICYYDINGNYMSGGIGGNFTTPQNCFYFVISILQTNKETITISTENIMEEVIRGMNNNLFSGISWVDNYFLNYSSGARAYNASYCYTNEFIPVGANNPIALGLSGCHTCFYDINKIYISGVIVSGFTTPSNCAYMRVSIEKAKKETAQCLLLKDDYVVLENNGLFNSFKNALDCANAVHKPLLVKGGTWDVSSVVGNLYVSTDIIGVGKPTIIANKQSFDVNFSPLNFSNKTNVKISGIKIVANNCRYCIHDEMGGNGENDYCTHIIENCELIQNTPIQESFTYPRCIGIGLGNNCQIIINNCTLTSNVPEEIDVHTGYRGQVYPSEARITNCVMKTGTVSATSINIGSGVKDVVIVSNCLVNAEPFVNTSATDNVELIKYNNAIVS